MKLSAKPMTQESNIQNVYDTSDPQKLLQLKRMESDALLDVLRYINHSDMTISHLCTIVGLVLRAQLGVKQQAFYYSDSKSTETWVEGIKQGFDTLSEETLDEVVGFTHITAVDPEQHLHLSEHAVEYVIPITHQEELVGFFLIADFADSEVEAQNDLIFIETIGYIMGVAIRNQQLFEEKMNQEFLRKELEVAETIQKQLITSDFSRFPEIDVYGINEAHHGVGGDFYDIIRKGDQQIFLSIADVSGKGIGAALLMANLQAHLRALCAQYDQVSTIVKELNQTLYQITEGEKFVTLFIMKLDLATRSFSYVNAGHNYPIFIHQGNLDRLDRGCMLLGIVPTPTLNIEEVDRTYEAGDLLMMFTDGVVEQTNHAGEMFGSERMGGKILEHMHLNAQELIQKVRFDLQLFAQEIESQDDITMLGLKFS